jgi:hypothetical protein
MADASNPELLEIFNGEMLKTSAPTPFSRNAAS